MINMPKSGRSSTDLFGHSSRKEKNLAYESGEALISNVRDCLGSLKEEHRQYPNIYKPRNNKFQWKLAYNRFRSWVTKSPVVRICSTENVAICEGLFFHNKADFLIYRKGDPFPIALYCSVQDSTGSTYHKIGKILWDILLHYPKGIKAAFLLCGAEMPIEVIRDVKRQMRGSCSGKICKVWNEVDQFRAWVVRPYEPFPNGE